MAAAAYKAVEQRTPPLPIRRMLAEVSGGGKWFGKKGCSLNGALYVRPGGTSKNIIRAGEGKTRFDGTFFGDQLCNHEDMDVDVLYVSKMWPALVRTACRKTSIFVIYHKLRGGDGDAKEGELLEAFRGVCLSNGFTSFEVVNGGGAVGSISIFKVTK